MISPEAYLKHLINQLPKQQSQELEETSRDPRIDVSFLERLHGSPLPTDPVEQNREW